MTTLQRARRFIARRFEIDESEIKPESRLDGLGIDSLATMELLFDIEDEFGIRIPESHGRIATLSDLVAMIEREITRRQPAAA
ncbi:MAG: phosphopantetheine-binding protein [Bacillota bacterium]